MSRHVGEPLGVVASPSSAFTLASARGCAGCARSALNSCCCPFLDSLEGVDVQLQSDATHDPHGSYWPTSSARGQVMTGVGHCTVAGSAARRRSTCFGRCSLHGKSSPLRKHLAIPPVLDLVECMSPSSMVVSRGKLRRRWAFRCGAWPSDSEHAALIDRHYRSIGKAACSVKTRQSRRRLTSSAIRAVCNGRRMAGG